MMHVHSHLHSSRRETGNTMSLTSFSSEGAGDRSDGPARAQPRSNRLVVETPLAAEAEAGTPAVGFELAMAGGLDIFSPERGESGSDARSQPRSDARAVSPPISIDMARGVSQDVAFDVLQGQRSTSVHEPRIEPVRALRPVVTSAAPLKRQAAPQPAPAFVRTPPPDIASKQDPEPAIAPRPVQPNRPHHVPAVVAVPPAKEEAKPAPKRPARPKTSRRWRPQVSAQGALLTALIVGGVIEVGWIGMRVAKAASETPAAAAPVASLPQPAAAQPVAASARPAETAPAGAVPQAAPPPVDASAPPAAPPKPPVNLTTPKAPVWVTISATIPVEILEGGRRLATSWGGGLRLSPGTHDLRIVSPAMNIDARQTVVIIAGGVTSLVVDYAEGRLRVQTRRSE
jgi:hypothetical protein